MEFVNKFFDSIEKGDYVIALFAVALLVAFKARAIYEFYDAMRSTKINKLSEYSKLENTCPMMKEHIQDCINNEIFRISTGINAEKDLREKIIHVQKNSNGTLSYKKLKQALPFLKINESKLRVQVRKWDRVALVFNAFLAMVLVFFASFFFMLPSLVQDATVYQVLISTLIGIGIYLFAGFVISETFPIRTALAIKNDIEKFNEI